jgi:predicted transcriptional regulator
VNQTSRSRLPKQVSLQRRRRWRSVSRQPDRWSVSRHRPTSTAWSIRLFNMTLKISLIRWNNRHRYPMAVPTISSRNSLIGSHTGLKRRYRAMSW